MKSFRILVVASALMSSSDVLAFAPSMPSGSVSNHRHQTELSMSSDNSMETSRRQALATSFAAIATAVGSVQPVSARLEAVNRPDLLPSEAGLNVIQTEKFLTTGQAKRMNTLLENLEKDTGFRLRVLCQSYPNTPGLAIRDYWDLGKEVRCPRDYRGSLTEKRCDF